MSDPRSARSEPSDLPELRGLIPDARERQILRLRHACGCTSGMVVMLMSLAGYLAHLQLLPASGTGWDRRALTGLGIALAGAVVGKLAGLLWARARLARLLRLQAESAPSVS